MKPELQTSCYPFPCVAQTGVGVVVMRGKHNPWLDCAAILRSRAVRVQTEPWDWNSSALLLFDVRILQDWESRRAQERVPKPAARILRRKDHPRLRGTNYWQNELKP